VEFRSSSARRIALVGDFNSEVTAHRAIPVALRCAAADLGADVRFEWLHTSTLGRASRALAGFDGIWCVPASPYADTEAALSAIRFAREQERAFLGTCGGFQHALLEYARNVLGIATAAHAELDPEVLDPLIAPLSCSLVEAAGTVSLESGSLAARAYGRLEIMEEYHCRYGLSPRFESLLDQGALRVTGRDAAGEARAVELDGHSFFVATLFQPERSALRGKTPPIVRAFVEAARSS